MGIFSRNRVFGCHSKGQEGQVLLIVVLAAVVSLTVGLSAVSRSITNTKLSTEEANSQKALSAAEAGIEKLLNDVTLGESSGNLSNDSTFNASVNVFRSNTVKLNDGGTVFQNEGADVWLSNSNFSGDQWSGTLTVRWTNNSASNCRENAAIEVAVISGTDRNNPTLRRYAYATSCSGRTDNFDSPTLGSAVVSGKTYNQGFSIPITNGYIARVIPVYANTSVVVQASGGNLPPQGNIIDSLGTSGNTSRKIRVYQGYPKVPIEFFPYSLFLPL